jgi:hypothetical protein
MSVSLSQSRQGKKWCLNQSRSKALSPEMQKDQATTKSLDRSLVSTLSLADVLLEEGVKIIPGGELAYKLTKILGKHARQYLVDRREERFAKFHQQILVGIAPESQEDFLKAKFSMEDYSAILTHIVQDEENAKVDLYARLFKAIILGVVVSDYKNHFIKATRELTKFDFDIMRQMHIYDTYELMGFADRSAQLSTLLKPTDPLTVVSLDKLTRLGFLWSRNDPPQPTKLLKPMVEIFFSKEELMPESIGARAKTSASTMATVIIACKETQDYIPILTALNHALYSQQIICTIGNIIRPISQYPPTVVVGICIGSKGSPIENVRKYVGFENRTLIQILLPGSEAEILPLDGVPIINLRDAEGRASEIDRFVTFVKDAVEGAGLTKPLVITPPV